MVYIDNWVSYAIISYAFSMNSLRRGRCCCERTVHCNKSRDPVEAPLAYRELRPLPAIHHLTN